MDEQEFIWDDFPDDQAEVLAQIDAELASERPISDYLCGLRFESWSNGHNRPKRSYPREVVFLRQPREERWTFVRMESDRGFPWDTIAQEYWPDEVLGRLPEHPSDYLRHLVHQMLIENGQI